MLRLMMRLGSLEVGQAKRCNEHTSYYVKHLEIDLEKHLEEMFENYKKKQEGSSTYCFFEEDKKKRSVV